MGGVDLLLEVLLGGGRRFHVALYALYRLAVMREVVVLDGDSAVNCGRLLLIRGGFRSQFFYLHGYSAARAHQLFYLSRYLFELALRLLIVSSGEGYFILLRPEPLAGALYRLEPESYLKLLFLPCKHKEFLRLFALRFERSDASFELGQYIAQANEIFLRLFESAGRVRAAVSEMGYSRRLFEHIAPLRRARRDKVGDSALADHGIAVASESRVHKQLVDIAQADSLAVQLILALARAVVAAGDGDIVLVAVVEGAVGVIEAQSDLGKAHRLSERRAAEYDVLHFRAAQAL